jgi:chaperonin GroEL (HSP60 family)
MKKLVVNHLEKILVTSDCATIVQELEVGHSVMHGRQRYPEQHS